MGKNSIKTKRDRSQGIALTSKRTVVPPIEKPSGSSRVYVTLIALGALVVLGAAAFIVSERYLGAKPDDFTPEERICDQFMKLRDRGDAAAADLLNPEPAPAARVVSPEEADRLQTEYFLHDPNLKIKKVRLGPNARNGQEFILVTRGNVAAPSMAVRENDQKVSNQQRTMSNPDLHVKVKDGKIVGVRSELHFEAKRN